MKSTRALTRRLLGVAVLAALPLLVAAQCDVPVTTSGGSSPTLSWGVRDQQTGQRLTFRDGDTYYAAPEASLSVTLHVEDSGGIRSIIFYGSQTGRCRDSLGDVDETYGDQRLDFASDAQDGTAPSRWTAGFQTIAGSCPTGGPAWVNAELHGYASNFSGLDRNSSLSIRIPLPSGPID